MKFDTLIKGGQLVIPKVDIIAGDLAIKDEKIAAIFDGGNTPEAEKVIDATGRFVMPGVIDPHVHLGLGGPATGFKSETESAAFGGVTTILDYIMGSQPYDEIYKEQKESGERDAYVDFGFHFTLGAEEQLAAIEKYVTQFGVSSFKLLMTSRGEEGLYLGVSGIDDGFMYAYFEALARFQQGIACVHPENIEVVWRLRKRLIDQGREDVLAWTESRPAFVEAEAIYRASYLAHVAGCSLYLPHITSCESLNAALSSRSRYGSIFLETCPHYLTHTADSVGGVIGKVNPPLRFQADIDSLWEAIANGSIDTIGSDHVPRLKEKKVGSVWKASAGYPGVETLLPVLLSEGVNKRGISLQRIAELTSYNPSCIFNLYPRKGTLLPGSDADVTVVDLGIEKKVTASKLHGSCNYSLYEGWTLKGWPTLTMVRGRVVMRDHKLLGNPGYGRYLYR